MITAPDVFTIDSNGTYTPDVAVDWVAAHGVPSPLYIGRTLRYSPDIGWQFMPGRHGTQQEWTPLSEAPKTLRSTIGDLDDIAAMVTGFEPDRAAYYELIGPRLARNRHNLDEPRIVRHGAIADSDSAEFTNVPTTSLWALVRTWFPTHDNYQGILWTWDADDSDWPRHAAVHRDRLPHT